MKVASLIGILVLSTALSACGITTRTFVLPDGRKGVSLTETDAMMTSRSIWAESRAGSDEYAPVSHMAVAGPLPTLGPSLIQGPIGWLFAPSGGGAASNVFVTATGGDGGSANAVAK